MSTATATPPRVNNPEPRASRFHRHRFDYIIIGGGTAGCILAARLSERPDVSVLLLEAGISDASYIFSRIPPTLTRLFNTSASWDFHSEPEAGLGGRKIFSPRGRMLGGCSSLNAMIYHRSAPSDYDAWAEITGDASWRYENMIGCFTRSEHLHRHKDMQPLSGDEHRYHGVDGFWHLTYPEVWAPQTASFLQACAEAGVPLLKYFSNGEAGTLGAAKFPRSIYKMERMTSRRAMLSDSVLKSRKNLVVGVRCHVTRILFEDVGSAAGPRAVAVQFKSLQNGKSYTVHVNQEIILSAGAIQSPHLLLLSGVGPKQQLAEHSIPLVHDLPGVGGSLFDHVACSLTFHARNGTTFNRVDKFPYAVPDIVKWLIGDPTSRIQSNLGEAACFIRVSSGLDGRPEAGERMDRASSSSAPHVEICNIAAALIDHGRVRPSGDMFTLSVVLLNPRSSGRIVLSSKDPMKPPKICGNYLSDPRDIEVLTEGVQRALDIANQPSLKALYPADAKHPMFHPSMGLHRDDTTGIRKWIRETSNTLYHPTSTCKMGAVDDGKAVVDSKLRVRGVRGLRIADASIMPYIVSGHTMAPVIAIAEKAAEMIIQDSKIPVKLS